MYLPYQLIQSLLCLLNLTNNHDPTIDVQAQVEVVSRTYPCWAWTHHHRIQCTTLREQKAKKGIHLTGELQQ